MNITTLFYICLFIPFIILFAIFGTTFMIAGHKKDLGRSLISFGATVGAIVASLGLSKLLAWGLSFPIANAFKNQVANENAMTSALVGGSLQGIVKIVLSLVLFAIFFPIALGVLKSILTKRINADKLNYNTNKSRLGGLGVRFVDAFLVVLMLSLPLYGTLAMLVPPIASLAQITLSEEEAGGGTTIQPTSTAEQSGMSIANLSAASVTDEEMFEQYFEEEDLISPNPSDPSTDYLTLLNTVADHPVLIPYQYGPADWVYSGLSSFSMNGKTVDVARATEVMNGLTDRFMTFTNAIKSNDEEQTLVAVEELVSYTRNNVIEERWFYNMFMALMGEFDKAVSENTIELGESEELVSQLRPLFDMSYKEFKSNGVALLDFFKYILNEKSLLAENSLRAEEELFTSHEFLSKFGALINHSKQAASGKQLIYMLAISDKFETQNTDAAFANWGNGLLTDANEQKSDAALFYALTSGADCYEILQLMAIHPLFGGEASAQLLTEETLADLICESYHYYGDSKEVQTQIQNNKSIFDDFKAKLISYEPLSFLDASFFGGENSFEDYVVSVVSQRLDFDFKNPGEFSGYFSVETDGDGQQTVYVIDEDGNKHAVSSVGDGSITYYDSGIAVKRSVI